MFGIDRHGDLCARIANDPVSKFLGRLSEARSQRDALLILTDARPVLYDLSRQERAHVMDHVSSVIDRLPVI